jgi:pimeloyl-ACP methyl ester carboxylesterase
LLWGEKDDQAPLRVAKEMAKLIPRNELKIIDGAGHNTFLEKPDLFFGYVSSFIKNISSS